MPIYIDPETRQRIVYQGDCSDITYLADNADESITHESVPVIGPWTDYTGSGGVLNNVQLNAGVENAFWGTDEEMEVMGTKAKNNLNNVGDRLSTTRRRQKLIYRKFK
jgi:hypothetical protein